MDPASYEEYLKRFATNNRIDGYGIGSVHIHMACPFCGMPDFMVYEIMEVQLALHAGAICKHCHRGAKAIFSGQEGSVSFEVVQYTGPDPAEWLPVIRRV